jgi:hypothetical protein
MAHQTKERRKKKPFNQLSHKLSNNKGCPLPHIAQKTNLRRGRGIRNLQS